MVTSIPWKRMGTGSHRFIREDADEATAEIIYSQRCSTGVGKIDEEPRLTEHWVRAHRKASEAGRSKIANRDRGRGRYCRKRDAGIGRGGWKPSHEITADLPYLEHERVQGDRGA